MNAYDRAAGALLAVRTAVDDGITGDHRAAALGAVLELWASGSGELWVRVAAAELMRERLTQGELRACVDDCMRRAAALSAASSAPRRTTMLPPPSGNEEREERRAARDTLESYPVGGDEAFAAAGYSTLPASAEWYEADRRASRGGLRL